MPRDLDDPAVFVMIERWRSEATWRAHMAARHIAEFRTKADGRLASFHITRLTETE